MTRNDFGALPLPVWEEGWGEYDLFGRLIGPPKWNGLVPYHAGKIDMTLEQLRIFVAVAERQHVTEAARALNLAQSAASHAIAALEARHDTKLFDRVGRRIELTEAGHIFLAEARAVLARTEAAELANDTWKPPDPLSSAVTSPSTPRTDWLCGPGAAEAESNALRRKVGVIT